MNDITEEIAGHHVEDSVAFVIDDRVDAALEARAKGIKGRQGAHRSG